ncbi:unnamed protein product [Gordionus sp. m RMFG-2023]
MGANTLPFHFSRIFLLMLMCQTWILSQEISIEDRVTSTLVVKKWGNDLIRRGWSTLIVMKKPNRNIGNLKFYSLVFRSPAVADTSAIVKDPGVFTFSFQFPSK